MTKWRQILKAIGSEEQFEWSEVISPSQEEFFSALGDNHSVIYLVRHGKTKLNKLESGDSVDRIRGWVDVPLDDDGLEQAQEIGEYLSDKGIQKIYSSDLSRALVTAKEIEKTTGASIEKTEALRPWNLGELQGQETQKIQPLIESYVKKQPQKAPNDGESFVAFVDRFINEFYSIMQDIVRGENTCIAVVAHFRNLKTLQAWFEGGQTQNSIDENVILQDDIPVGSMLKVCYNKDENTWGYLLLKCEVKG